MSQFAFLQREWAAVFDAAAKAEAAMHADPRTACFYARRALELAVSWAYKHDAALNLPYQDNLSALIHEPSFKQAAGEAVFSKARVINTRRDPYLRRRRTAPPRRPGRQVATGLSRTPRRAMDMTGWLEYFVSGLEVQLEEVKARGAAVIKGDVLARSHRLTERQAAVLGEVHAAGPVALGGIEPSFPDVSRRSLQRDLKVLLEKGLIEEIAAARTDPNRRYAPAREHRL